jgi:hypothetical protein
MKSELLNISIGDATAKIRSLGLSMAFAPVDFSAWLSSERSDEEIETFIAGIESGRCNGSENYQRNIAQIAQYRDGKLIKEQHNVTK